MIKRNTETHESYGMLSFSRFSTSGTNHYFGSSIEHSGGISLKISTAEIDRHLSNDWFHDLELILHCEMSPSQFTEAITNMNNGSGVPVTLRFVNGKKIEEPPFTNKRLQFEEEFSSELRQLASKLRDSTAKANEYLKQKKPLTVAQKGEILSAINSCNRFLTDNAIFINSQFNEQMDKTVKEAKGEVDNMITHTIAKLGMEKLSELKQLSSGETSEN